MMTRSKITVSKPYKTFYTATQKNILCNTPRASGKSYEVAQFAALRKIEYPRHDIVIFRANANSLSASVVNEVLEKFDMLSYGDYTRVRQAPLRIDYNQGESAIYFLGVSGHDKSRVRGFKPRNPLCLIIGDECQQITEEINLQHALATFRRYFDDHIDYKTVLCGNPHEVKGHWWNAYNATHANAPEYIAVKSTYLDIYNLLNDDIRQEIELEKKINPALYPFMYLGDISELSGGAYPSFRRDKHLITPEQASEMFRGEFIETVIIGVDGAITHDMTCASPIAIMSSGRACVLEPFVFDPISHGRALAPSELSDLFLLYMRDMEKKYAFKGNNIPVVFAVDCAAEDLITQLRYSLPDYYTVLAYTGKNVIRNTSTANNVFARNIVYIINYGGYKDYTSGRFVERDVPLLVDQLESVTWKNNKLDPAVPNDASDSFVYGVCCMFENPANLYLPERKEYYD